MGENTNRYRYKPRDGLYAIALAGDFVVNVLREHPVLCGMVEVQGSNGARDWVRIQDIYKLRAE